MSARINYNRITGSNIQGDATTVTEPLGTLVVTNNGDLRLHDGTTQGGVAVSGSGSGFATTSTLVNGDFNFTLGVDGTINFDPSSANGKGILQTAADLQFIAVDKTWTFSTNSNLTVPGTIVGNSGALDLNYDGSVVLSGIPSVDAVIQTTTSGSSNTSTWTFGTDGSTELSRAGNIKGYYRPQIGTKILVLLNALGDNVNYSPGTLPNPINSSTNLIAAGWNIVDKDGLTAVVTDMYYAGDVPPNNRVTYSGTLGSNPYPITFTSPDYVAEVTSNITIVATTGSNTSTWTFGTDGGLTLPLGGYITAPSAMGSNTVIQAPGSNRALLQNSDGTNLVAADDQGVAMTTVRGTVQFGYNLEAPGVPTHFHINKLNQSFDLFFGDDANYFHLPASGGAPVIGAYGDSVQKLWTFGQDGGLIFPDSTVQTTAWTGTVAYSNVTGTPTPVLTTSTLINGDYSVGLGTDGILTLSTASTILGAGTDPNVYIETVSTSTTSTWTFGTNGILTLPAATPVIKGGGTGTDVTIIASTGSNTSTWVFAADGTLTVPGAITAADGQSPGIYASSGNAAVVSNYSGNNQLFVQDDGVYVQTSVNNSGTTFTSWKFGNDGGLTFPDSTVQTTAWTGVLPSSTPPALESLLSTATTIAITDATEQNGPATNITVEITNHQLNHYGTTSYTDNIISTGLVVIPDTTQSPPIDHSIMKPGTVQLTQTYNLGVGGSPANSHYIAYAYVVTPFGTVWSAPTSGTLGGVCLLAGTMISLADGSYKAIEDITYTDSMLSWNFDQGCYAETKAVWIKRSETGSQYNLLTFSDGTTLRTFDQHRIFNKQAGAFTYPMTDATPIGTITVNEHGQEITLVDKQVIVDTIEYYNVITDYHMNLFSDSILTSCRFNNIYHITDMKFVKDGRTLRTRDEFENIPDRFFYGLRLAEQTTDIETVEWYVNRLLSLEQSSESVVV